MAADAPVLRGRTLKARSRHGSLAVLKASCTHVASFPRSGGRDYCLIGACFCPLLHHTPPSYHHITLFFFFFLLPFEMILFMNFLICSLFPQSIVLSCWLCPLRPFSFSMRNGSSLRLISQSASCSWKGGSPEASFHFQLSLFL